MKTKDNANNELSTLAAGLIEQSVKNSDIKEAGRVLGASALVVAKTIQTVLLPLAALNYGAQKTKEYFITKFEPDISEKLDKIPLESIVAPKASVAAPVLQGLAFCYEEADIKNMYLNLLANAMDGRVKNKVHPAFVEIIKQISSPEVIYLNSIFKTDSFTEIVEARETGGSLEGYRTVGQHIMDLRHQKTHEFIEDPELPSMIDNWIRLGLVIVDYTKWAVGENKYRWVDARPEVIRLRSEAQEKGCVIEIKRGVLDSTNFGTSFAKAVGII